MRNERLFDPVRKLEVRALPEERVRRQLVDWLLGDRGVPLRLVSVEFSLSRLHPATRKRADVVVWQPVKAGGTGGLAPWLLAECKAPGTRLTNLVADQVRGYAQKVRAEHVLVTNGSETLCFRLTGDAYRRIPALDRFPASKA